MKQNSARQILLNAYLLYVCACVFPFLCFIPGNTSDKTPVVSSSNRLLKAQIKSLLCRSFFPGCDAITISNLKFIKYICHLKHRAENELMLCQVIELQCGRHRASSSTLCPNQMLYQTPHQNPPKEMHPCPARLLHHYLELKNIRCLCKIIIRPETINDYTYSF